MKICQLVSSIPHSQYFDEAWDSIQTIVISQYRCEAKITCHMTQKFRIFVRVRKDGVITLIAENRRPVFCNEAEFLSVLHRFIFEINEELSSGFYKQTPVEKLNIIDYPPPPAEMDIPVWDEKTGQWYDAEY